MLKKDYCKHVDVFYGNGEVDHFPEEGLTSKWFYIKAICGNTTPHAVMPFGKMSVGAYSGGYPTGYGTHWVNSSGGIKKLFEKNSARGFSHIHNTGVGGIKYYYNYAIATPFYGKLNEINAFHILEKEKAKPGYYSAKMNSVLCEMTVNHSVAFHRYTFQKNGGRLAVDFSNDGLSKSFGEAFYSYAEAVELKKEKNKIFFSGTLSGVKLYFCAVALGTNVGSNLFFDNCEADGDYMQVENTQKNFGVVFDFNGDEISLKLSYSTKSYKDAERNVDDVTASFEEISERAYKMWNGYLSAIDIETKDEELKKKFYSNFYHSIIKPVDMTGECVLGIEGQLITDFATFWDQYKTLLPLIFMLYPDMSKKIVSCIKNISCTLGKIPCSLGLSNILPCEQQAKMLGIFVLCDAYYSGVKNIDEKLISDCIKRELERDDFKSFIETGFFERYTHILDVTDACLDVAEITEDKELKERLLKLAENWKNAYSEKDGLMSENSPYYEGDRYTYSFRLQKNIQERIAFAGGKEKFIKMLDDFFGFGKESLKQLTYIGAGEDIINTHHHRFEGFNNECDMETPYAYIYAGCHNRTADIIHSCINQSFTSGKGGLPGNNDSGGLSSCFMWNVLGLFPVSGTGDFLIGSPHIKHAKITLANGKTLEIETNFSGENYYVDTVEFNDKKIADYKIRTQELIKGGKIIFCMKSKGD